MTAEESRIEHNFDIGAPIPDLRAIEDKWLRQCASCDAGLPYACTCPGGDFRPVLAEVIAEVWRTRAVAQQAYSEIFQRFIDLPDRLLAAGWTKPGGAA